MTHVKTNELANVIIDNIGTPITHPPKIFESIPNES